MRSGMAMKNRMARKSLVPALGLASFALAGAVTAQSVSPATDWKDWGGDAARKHYSALGQITAVNVSGLKPTWVWDGGKFGRSWEITPLLIDGRLYISENQTGDIIAL